MTPERIEIFTAEIQEKTLPGWLRGHGVMVLCGEHFPHWPGPNLSGWSVFHALSVHNGHTVESEGMTLWFLKRENTDDPFGPGRMNEAAQYIFQRLDRKAHQPKGGFTSIVMLGTQPGNN